MERAQPPLLKTEKRGLFSKSCARSCAMVTFEPFGSTPDTHYIKRDDKRIGTVDARGEGQLSLFTAHVLDLDELRSCVAFLISKKSKPVRRGKCPG